MARNDCSICDVIISVCKLEGTRALIYVKTDILPRTMYFGRLGSYHCVQRVNVCVTIIASRKDRRAAGKRKIFTTLFSRVRFDVLSLSSCKRKVEDGVMIVDFIDEKCFLELRFSNKDS